MAFFAADQIDGIGMVFDVFDHLHGQHSSLKGIAGVVATFNAIAVGIAVAHGVTLLVVHESRGLIPPTSRMNDLLPSSRSEENLVI